MKGVHREEFPAGYEMSVWYWEPLSKLSDEQIEEVVALAKKDHINTIYLSIDQYVDIYEMKRGAERTSALQGFENRLSLVVDRAAENGIAVHALGGGPQWASDSHRYIPALLIDYVHGFNQKPGRESKIAGIQFDIEFYNRKDFQRHKTEYTKEFLALETDLAQKAASYRLKLGFAVPFWMDGGSRNVLPVQWNGKSAYPVFHMIEILNGADGAYLAVMSYRTFTQGNDGSVAHVRKELEYAKEKSLSTKIIVGQDVSSSGVLSKVTFFGMGRNRLVSSVNEIAKAYGGYTNLGGFAVNDFKHYKDMRD